MTTSSFSISGLASGLDWSSMITQLVEVQKKPITLLETSKTTLSNKKSAWDTVNTKLTSLKTAAAALSARDDFDVFKPSATVTGTSKAVEDILSFAVGTNASEGSYEITVNKLATAQKLVSTNFSSQTTALGISGNVTINDRELTVAATDTLSDIQKKINAMNSGDNPADVTASIISVSSGEYRLTLTSKNTGVEGMSITDGTGALGLTQLVEGQDAEIVVDGYTITRSKNQISDVISGVTLNLVSEDEGATVTLNVGRDYDGIKEKIQDFVDSYNDLMKYIATQNTSSADGKTTGTLFADSSLQSIKSSLRGAVLSTVSGADSTLNRLSSIGISVDKTGQLSIDDDTLDGYLETNFNDVVNIFAAQGSSTSSSLTYVASGQSKAEGDYEVEISQTATRPGVTGSVFSGTLISAATLTLTSAGGTEQTVTLDAGSDLDAIVNAINEGNTLGIKAENDGGSLKLSNESYGSSGNFTVSGISGELGVADGTYTGVDVAGRIRAEGSSNWMTMTGRGQSLTGDDDQDVEGLVIAYTGTSTGTLDLSLVKGIGDKLDQALYSMTDSVDGYVANKQTLLQTQMDNLDKKIDNMEARLTKYQDTLVAKYSAMESLLNSLQSQQSWLTSQINSLTSSS
jgi:flagellar hook-associated protein 2